MARKLTDDEALFVIHSLVVAYREKFSAEIIQQRIGVDSKTLAEMNGSISLMMQEVQRRLDGDDPTMKRFLVVAQPHAHNLIDRAKEQLAAEAAERLEAEQKEQAAQEALLEKYAKDHP